MAQLRIAPQESRRSIGACVHVGTKIKHMNSSGYKEIHELRQASLVEHLSSNDGLDTSLDHISSTNHFNMDQLWSGSLTEDAGQGQLLYPCDYA